MNLLGRIVCALGPPAPLQPLDSPPPADPLPAKTSASPEELLTVGKGPPTTAPATAVTPPPPVKVPRKISFTMTYPPIPVFTKDGEVARRENGEPITARMSSTGLVSTTWDSAWFKQQLQTCRRLGIDPYFWLAAQMFEFPGGYTDTQFKVSVPDLNNASRQYCLRKLVAQIEKHPEASDRVVTLALLQFLQWSGEKGTSREILERFVKQYPVPIDVDIDPKTSQAEALAVRKFLAPATMLSGKEMIDAEGAPSGTLVADAALQSRNLFEIQRQLPQLAKDYKVTLTTQEVVVGKDENGHDIKRTISVIDPTKPENRRAAYEQSFRLLVEHQKEIARALDQGEALSASFQLFNGRGGRKYWISKDEVLRVNAKDSAYHTYAYGASMIAMMHAMADPNNGGFAELRALVQSVYGDDPARYPLTARVTAGIGDDPYARYFGSDLSKLCSREFRAGDRQMP